MPLFTKIFNSERSVSAVGKKVFITGGNTGIGFQTALELVLRGAEVVIGCRNEEKMKSAIQRIESVRFLNDSADSKQGSISGQLMDLQSFDSVRNAAKELHSKMQNIDICILNAGIMRVPLQISDHLELQQKVNHFSHFILLNDIIDLIEKSPGRPRIISVSSDAHKFANGKSEYWRTFKDREEYKNLNLEDPIDTWIPYGESKLANVCHIWHLAKLKPNIGCFSVHPGVVNTELFRDWKNHSKIFSFLAYPLMRLLMKTPFQGAQTSIFCALEETLEDPKLSGGYYSNCALAKTKFVNDEMASRLWTKSEEITQSKLL